MPPSRPSRSLLDCPTFEVRFADCSLLLLILSLDLSIPTKLLLASRLFGMRRTTKERTKFAPCVSKTPMGSPVELDYPRAPFTPKRRSLRNPFNQKKGLFPNPFQHTQASFMWCVCLLQVEDTQNGPVPSKRGEAALSLASFESQA